MLRVLVGPAFTESLSGTIRARAAANNTLGEGLMPPLHTTFARKVLSGVRNRGLYAVAN